MAITSRRLITPSKLEKISELRPINHVTNRLTTQQKHFFLYLNVRTYL